MEGKPFLEQVKEMALNSKVTNSALLSLQPLSGSCAMNAVFSEE
jgi:hypothetical protein